MEPKVIFEIPVYSMSEEKFYKKWKFFNEYNIKHFLELNDELGNYERWLKRFNLPQSIWKYNQIIGYIQIIIKGKDIILTYGYAKIKDTFIIQLKSISLNLCLQMDCIFLLIL